MPEILNAADGRALVSLRTHMNDRQAAVASLALPTAPLTTAGDDPAALWLAPEQWLLVSAKRSARSLISEIEAKLPDLVWLANDMTSAFRCYSLAGRLARSFLATGSGVDFDALAAGQCVRTRFANIELIAMPIAGGTWEVFVDVSHAMYFESWFRRAATDDTGRTVTSGSR